MKNFSELNKLKEFGKKIMEAQPDPGTEEMQLAALSMATTPTMVLDCIYTGVTNDWPGAEFVSHLYGTAYMNDYSAAKAMEELTAIVDANPL